MQLAQSDKQLVNDMAATLRLAEALDRSHRQVVQRVEFDLQTPGKGQEKTATLLIFVRPGESWEPETWALKEKKGLL